MIEPDSLCKFSEARHHNTKYPIYELAIEWLLDFISNPHAELGRSGPICPFVPAAIKKDLIMFGVMKTTRNTNQEAVSLLFPIVDTFKKMKPTEVIYNNLKSLILFFPDLDPANAHDFIDNGHEMLKRHYVENGLMIGEFHAKSLVPGYYNHKFLPMRCSVPAFVIRYMSVHDIAFLNQSLYTDEVRLFFLENYFKYVGCNLNDSQRSNLTQIMAELNQSVAKQSTDRVDLGLSLSIVNESSLVEGCPHD